MKSLKEAVLDLTDEEELKQAKELLDSNKVDDVEKIIDTTAETKEELQDSYASMMVFECETCHSKIFANIDELTKETDSNLYTFDDEEKKLCPNCHKGEEFRFVSPVLTSGKSKNEIEQQLNDQEDKWHSSNESNIETENEVGEVETLDNDEVEVTDDTLEETPTEEVVEESLNESVQLTESVSETIKIYEVEKDGSPEVGREFIAFAEGHNEVQVFKRVSDEKWKDKSDASQHISSDGHFYAGVNGWIYSITFDRYIYLDELNLKSSAVIDRQKTENEHKTEVITNAFIDLFGETKGKQLADRCITIEKGKVTLGLPWSLYDNNLDINHYSVCDKGDCSQFIKYLTNKGFSKDEAIELLVKLPELNWKDNYTKKKLIELQPEIETYVNSLEESFNYDLVEDINTESFDNKITNYLTETFDNVKEYKTVDCYLDDNKLCLEGVINFNSGKSRKSTFIFENKENKFVGYNNILTEDLNAFEFTYNVNDKCLNCEEFKYNYKVNDVLVEGISK